MTTITIALWIGFVLLRLVDWAIKARTRYWERRLAKAKANGEWLDALIVAQQEKNTVLEAELLCQLAAEYRRRL